MSSTVIALLLGVGFGGWVYSKALRQTGGNTQTAIIAAGASGFLAALVMWILLGFIPK